MSELVPTTITEKQVSPRGQIVLAVTALPTLIATQLITNPFITLTSLLLCQAQFPFLETLLGAEPALAAFYLVCPFYWAFLAGSACRINIAIARGEQITLSMLKPKYNQVRRYLALGITALCIIFVNMTLTGMFLGFFHAAIPAAVAAFVYLFGTAAIMLRYTLADLFVADLDCDAQTGLKMSWQLSNDNYLRLVLFYLCTYVAGYLLFAIPGMRDLSPLYKVLITLPLLSMCNYWRALLYCNLSGQTAGDTAPVAAIEDANTSLRQATPIAELDVQDGSP